MLSGLDEEDDLTSLLGTSIRVTQKMPSKAFLAPANLQLPRKAEKLDPYDRVVAHFSADGDFLEVIDYPWLKQ
eukprot:CAMPEP_0178404458 /NCGR_PEP_ID=MMETSP0689_2-20121128/17896_1 /TAXON_ID=160604 /ORGANISM="Amphidinium massartii, Strain CS-259" /LENGTH=72 /DNA_ID=CAMNT_0020025447 /DNA_START=223 /DNA_END=441 /DNA_ORIENTATION=+